LALDNASRPSGEYQASKVQASRAKVLPEHGGCAAAS
jgi:hypothetical protein